jgi:AraC family transcriptional regulator
MYIHFDPVNLTADCELDLAGAALGPRLFFEDSALWCTALKLKSLLTSETPRQRLYVEALGALLTLELLRLNAVARRAEVLARGGLAGLQQRIVTSYIGRISPSSLLSTRSRSASASAGRFVCAYPLATFD